MRPFYGNAKLAERNQDIVQRYLDGETVCFIAARYDISKQRVVQIVKRDHGLNRGGSGRPRVPRVTVTCERCGAEREVTPCRARTFRYCSNACRSTAKKISAGVLLRSLRDWAAAHGRTPGLLDMNSHPNLFTHTVYIRCFGSIRNAQKAAGLAPNARGYHGHRSVREPA